MKNYFYKLLTFHALKKKREREIPIQLLSASTPEGKMEYPQIAVFCARSAASWHKANRESWWLFSVVRQTNHAN